MSGMGWYRRSSRLISDAFRSGAFRGVPPRSSIRDICHRGDFHSCSSKPKFSSSIVSKLCNPVFRNPSLHNGVKQIQRQNPFLDGAKRFYYVDRYQVHHFQPKGFKRWIQNPRNAFIVVLVSSGVVISIYFGNLETVPYTKRTHFVLLSRSLEREMGDTQFKQIRNQFRGKILPKLHPDSIRVQAIAQDIIDALQKGLSKDQVWSDLRYSPEITSFPHDEVQDTVTSLSSKFMEEESWHKDEEVLDDSWAQQSRKVGQEKGKKSETAHLEGLKWEVIVVDQPLVNAFCLPGGKIVVFTGLLQHFRADSEIATVVGHEVGHAVARHGAEQISKNLWLTILQLVLYQFFIPDIVNTMSNLFLRLPFSRRMEMEADYIGLLLLASAGFDPRVAPQVYEKLGKIVGDSTLGDYLTTHPSGQKRAQTLSQAKVMEEALTIYRKRWLAVESKDSFNQPH